MFRRRFALTLFPILVSWAVAQGSGPYAPAAGQPGSTALRFDDPQFQAWSDTVVDYAPGWGVSESWESTDQALGPVGSHTWRVISLGEGGSITLGFSHPLADGPGNDFAVFENGISGNTFAFLELAYVEVSSDNENFVRFPSSYLGDAPIAAVETRGDPTLIDGLASKYTVSWGTPFDLAELRSLAGSEHLDFDAVRYIRIVDIIGDGSETDSSGRPIYDPFTADFEFGTNGFDLDGIGAIHLARPSLRSWQMTANGELELSWWVPTAGAWVHQSSSNLVDWTEQNLEASGEIVISTMPAASDATFHRLIRP